MPQDSMNVALPENLKEFVLEQVTAGGYSTASEYVRALIRADQKRKSDEEIQALLLEGLAGGTPTPLTEKDWQDIRAEVKTRLKQNRG